MKTDFLGKELNIGDKVVFMKLNYRELQVGVIIAMADKTCKIKHNEDNLCRTECRQYYGQLVRVE